jgi:hypothetical protein
MLCHRCHNLLLVFQCFVIAATIFYWYSDALSSLPFVVAISDIFAGSWNYALVYVQVWAEPGPFAKADAFGTLGRIYITFRFLALMTIFFTVYNICWLSLAICKGRLLRWH